jgi:hypothetical protein
MESHETMQPPRAWRMIQDGTFENLGNMFVYGFGHKKTPMPIAMG